MTVEDIRQLALSADPAAQHYESRQKNRDYTTFAEYRQLPTLADDLHVEAWAFQIDRFTKDENDPVAAAILAALDEDPRVSYEHRVDYERDTGFVHHIFDCEGC